jgi:hypothetical protein
MTAVNVQEALAELQQSKQASVTPPGPPSLNASVRLNPNVPSVDVPQADLIAIRTVTQQLRLGVQSLGGARGGQFDRAATLQDLIDLGLITAADCLAKLAGRRGPGPGSGP